MKTQFFSILAMTLLVVSSYAQLPAGQNPGGKGWADSFAANGLCWCDSTFDHDLGDINRVSFVINGQRRNIKDVCDELKKHPRVRGYRQGDPLYNDIQCGNGPANTAIDEVQCPGRVDKGRNGCSEIGPRWDVAWLSSRPRFGGGNNNNGGGKNIVVRAKGVSGGEMIRVRVDATTIATHTLTTDYREYETTTNSNGGLNVEYFNDSNNRDVQIDWLSVNGNRRQAEAQSYNTAVWQNGSCGGSNSEWMNCNGIIGFGNAGAKVAVNEAVSNAKETTIAIYPNPSTDGLFNLDITGFNGVKRIQVLDLGGRQIKQINVADNTYKLDMSAYNGFFLVRITDGEKTQVQKIMSN